MASEKRSIPAGQHPVHPSLFWRVTWWGEAANNIQKVTARTSVNWLLRRGSRLARSGAGWRQIKGDTLGLSSLPESALGTGALPSQPLGAHGGGGCLVSAGLAVWAMGRSWGRTHWAPETWLRPHLSPPGTHRQSEVERVYGGKC